MVRYFIGFGSGSGSRYENNSGPYLLKDRARVGYEYKVLRPIPNFNGLFFVLVYYQFLIGFG